MEKRKPKILLYTDTKQLGGAENHMLSLFKFYDRQGFELQLACSSATTLDTWCKKITDMTVTVHRLKARHKHHPGQYFELKKIIQQEEIDAVHIHVWNPASGRYGFMAARSAGVPHLFTEHDPFELSSIKNWLKKKLIKDASQVIAVSEKNKTLLSRIYPSLKSKIIAIHNGIDTTWFESQLLSFSVTDREEFRKDEFTTDGETPIVTCIAELHPRKGIMYLLEAAKLFKEDGAKIKFIIVGSGEEKKRYENFIKDHDLEDYVKLLGRRHDIPHILKASDLFVLPSLNEAFGLVLLEAMMAKLPIVATNNGGIPEIVKDGENGILVPAKDAKAIKKAIEKLFGSPATRKKMSEKSYEMVRKLYDVKDMVKRTEDVYRNLLNI